VHLPVETPLNPHMFTLGLEISGFLLQHGDTGLIVFLDLNGLLCITQFDKQVSCLQRLADAVSDCDNLRRGGI
jgi:hypothetical protein